MGTPYNGFLVHQAMDNTQGDPVGAFSKGLLTGQQAQANAFNLQRAPIEAQQRDDAVARDKQLQNLGMIGAAAYGVKTQEDLDRAKARLASQGIVPEKDLAAISMQDIPGIIADVQGVAGQIEEQRYREKISLGIQQWNAEMGMKAATAAAKPRPMYQAADGFKYYADNPTERVNPDAVARDRQGMRVQSDGAGGFTFEQGPGVTGAPGGEGEFGKKAVNDLEATYSQSANLFSRLKRTGELAGIDPATGRMDLQSARMLTYRGQGEDWLAVQAEKLGVAPDEFQRQAIEQRTRFTTSVEQLFNAYRKEITGAAAAVQELERLKKSFLNVDMSPTQFEAAYSEYNRELMRAMRVSAKLRREGVNLSTQAGGDTMDRAFLSGADDAPEDRFAELSQQGLSEDDIYLRMQSEGY